MLKSIVETIAGLVQEQLEELLQEVVNKILELINADDSEIEEWLDTLSPIRRMFAENLINFTKQLLELVADKLIEKDTFDTVA